MRKNLFKTWLVAIIAMMGAGTGWAQTVTTYDFEDGNALFTADSRVSVNVVEGTQTIYNESFELDGKAVSFKGASNAQNGYCFAHYDFSALCEQAAKVKVEFDAVLGNGARSIISVGDASVRGTTGNSSKTTYSNKGAIFRVGTDKSNSYVNAGNVGNSTVVSQKWLKVTVEVDETEKTYTYSIENKATGDILYSNGDDPITFYSSDATNCTQIDMFGYINNSQMGLIDNLVITVTQDERPQAEYTVKYVNEYGTEIKDPSTRSGAVGDAITLLPADFETFKTSDGTNKYFYNSDDSEGKTIASDGSTIITITYREAETWSWTVNFIVGETILGTKTGTVFEGDQAIVPYPKYLENAGQLYIKDKGLSTSNEFNYKFTPNGNAELKTIEYAIVDGVTNVVYCSEAEDIEGMTLCTSGNAAIRSSNSAAAYATQDVTFTTLPAGKYNMYVSLFDATKNHDSSWTIKAGAIDAATIDCAGINFTEYPTNEFAIGKETPIIIAKGGSDNIGVDAIYIVKTGEVTPEEAAELNQAADQAAALAEAKSILQQTITLAGSVNPEALADAISAAQTALDAEDATVETITAAAETLETAVKDYLKGIMPNVVAIVQVLNTEALSEALATAQSVLNDENATALQLASAMQQLITAAQPAAATALGNLREYAEKYGTAETVALVDNALAAVAAGNVPEIISTMAAVKDAATPLATGVLTQLIGYADTYNINADAAKEALQGGNYIAMIGAARTLFNNLISAAQAYVDSAKAIPTEGKEGADALATAIDAAEQALEAETIDFSAISTAISNLIDAIAAFNEANAETALIDTYFINAGLNPQANPYGWTAVTSDGYNDIGMGLIGEYKVRDNFASATVDETHLATEFCAGFECRWSSNYASFAQESFTEIPSGLYQLTFDVTNVNGNTQAANYENRFTVTVGDQVYTDQSTEWMNGQTTWMPHTIEFLVPEDGKATISLGYGTGANNYPQENTPALYVSHLGLEYIKSATEAAGEILQAEIAIAEAMLQDQDKLEGRTELQAVIDAANNALSGTNATEMINATQALKDAEKAFTLANQYIYDGVAYVIDAESGLFMAAGHDYGTRGIVNEIGLDLTFVSNETTRTVTIDSRVSNGENSHFLGSNLYMDSQAFNWILEYHGFGFYITNGTQYISLDANNNLVMSDTPREWILVTPEGVKEQRLSEMADASEENPMEATWLLQNPNFNRNDQRVSAWQVSADCTNKNLNGGNQVNNCAESWHSTFTISQIVEGAPAGKYTLTAQGFYRQDDNATEDAPTFFANEMSAELPARTGEENNMSAASVSFSNGLYTIDPITFTVGEDGILEVGAKGTATHQWVIFDNFQLTYLGKIDVEPVEPEEPIEPAYGTIWEGNLVCADDAYTYLPLSTAYFKDFAQVGDIVRISFTDAGINSQGDDVEEDEGYYSRGAAPMRDMKRYADLKVLGSDKVTLIYDAGNSLQGDNQNVDLTINEDMLATLSEGDNIYVMGKNLTITKVELLEQAAAIEPFYGVIWEEGLVCESVTDFESVALSTVYFKDFVQAGDTVRVSYSAAGEDYQDMSRGLGPKRQMVKTGSLRLLDNSQQIIDERINLVDAASEDFIITEENMNQFTDGEYIYVAGRNLTIDKVELIEKGKEDSELMKEAKALAADEDAVAVGKLIAAIDEAIETEDESNLQAAIDQFKADNADQENDKTNLVTADGWKEFETDNAAHLAPDWSAPAITTYDGRTTQPAEVYESTVETTGQIIYQNITGLANGSYKVGFYAHAAYTSGRGFESNVQEGDQDVAYVFANEEKAFIPAHIATSIAEYQLEEFNVEVTDGTITLGLGKEKAGTNWHTMQIYRLTWFTTAKEVYAIDQENLQTAIAEASVLLDDATKTEGREALQTAINIASLAVGSNWYNIPEIETIIAELANAIYNFKLANQYIFDGVAYVIDAESGKFMAAGHDYGTRGIVNETGLDLTFTSNETTRTVTIDSRVSNGENNHFLGSNLYMDSQAFNWILEYHGFGFYITNGTQYISLDANNNLVMSDTPREWILVTPEGVKEQRLSEMADASEENPMDATWLLQNPNFNRNDQRVSAWQVSDDCTNWNLNGGNQVNNCAESFHSTFTISQIVEGAPAGIYTLTAQGFYRQDGNVEEDVPVFFANDATAEVPAKTGEEGWMGAASESFSNGLYTIEPLRFVVTEGGNIEVGVRGTATQQWVIFDNFQLTYYGADPLAADKAALQALIDECEALQESYYTPETWSALADALAAANTALNASDATANSLAAAKDALQAAMDALVLSIDGINSLSATGKQLGTVYNLKGQKVSTPAKRLYIVRSAEGRLQGKNGKKVVLK